MPLRGGGCVRHPARTTRLVLRGLTSREQASVNIGEHGDFRRLARPIRAYTVDGREIHLKAGIWVRWVSASRDDRGELTWRFEDRAGNIYRVTGQLPHKICET